jgi:hypothetical protein
MGMKARSTAKDPGVRFVENDYSHPATGAKRATGTGLELASTFTEELPAKFRPYKPGRQFIRCATREDAEALTQELRGIIFGKWPTVKEWAGDGWYLWRLEDGREGRLTFRNKRPKYLARLRRRK